MSLSREWRRLRELDWRALDVKESGAWPWSLQLFCCLLVLGLAFGGVHWYLAAPKVAGLVDAKHQERELMRDYRDKAAQAASLPVVRKQVAELEERISALREMLPTDAEIPALIDHISETAIGNQLEIDIIRLRSPVEQEFYIEQPFDIQVRGDYHRIAYFLAGVASLPRIVTQHDFTLEPTGDQGVLRLSMLAKTYRYRPPGGGDEAQ
ncbi:pilus assembly protein PilP [Litchfieldella qijiaojingensis]|uniref:Pilus assembly protein PilP n=1 Tax=Litchfieldella qijiaojingensis TaxID=980347 RepID=A0ABQ2YYM8_9GAMM|nr:type 4a pilus biogenesis protein PilO [Halomonas qijiaojingensis]GGX97280.1 pilus assembly protein PilP [Halomonas qijiaojingensis]